jgi:hypothetical protein
MDKNLTEEDRQEFKKVFTCYDEICQRAKEIAEEKKAIVEQASKILEVKKTVASKVLKSMMKLVEGIELDETEVLQIIDDVKAGETIEEEQV